VVFVAGGSRGIGRACAVAFRDLGHPVAATWRTELPEPCAGILDLRCDVRSSDEVRAAVAEAEAALGPILISVANAGVMRNALVNRLTEEAWNEVIDTNLTGAFRVVQATLPGMISARWGRIVFISSAGAQTGYRGQANYIASKTGLLGLARTTSREWGSRGITANLVAPGLVPTLMTSEVERWDDIASHIPLGRLGTGEDVAAAVTFLASKDAAFITGANLPVDGGISMGYTGPS
jgi:3-oxoacyl-[acyl-carrier protein] reductase